MRGTTIGRRLALRLVVVAAPVWWLAACSAVEVLGPIDPGDGSGDSDSDGDGDTDADADSDSDSDVDTDVDSDVDTDTYTNCEEMPAESCDIELGVGETCLAPVNIGRVTVAMGSNIYINSLSGAADDDQSCGGLGPDQFYKLFIKAGEALTFTITTDTPGTFEPVVAVYKTADPCVGQGCAEPVICDENTDGGDTAGISGWSSTTSGWHVIKVDSREALSASGDYDIFVSLDCLSPTDCDC